MRIRVTAFSQRALGAAVIVVALAAAPTVRADGWTTLRTALGESKPIFDTRMRFEGVDQAPMENEAEALTWRARLGLETGKAWSTTLLVEGDLVWPLESDYNSTTNGAAAYPIVADPETYEINRLQLTNTALPMTTLTAGRQRIVLDDHRFVGNVGWRQNEQTFDSVRIVNKSLPDTTFDLAYVNQVNRVFGKESTQGRYEGDSVLANASRQFALGKLTAFGYWLEFEPIAAAPAAVRDSSETYGVRFGGEKALKDVKLGYIASYATQSERADNPLAFDLDYYLMELTGSYRGYSLGVGVETLEGDGVKGFTTPLATLHRFQGWADKFLTTPVDGVEDRYVNVGVTLKSVGPFEAVAALASYHIYEAERIAMDYGSEINAQLQAKRGRFTGLIKHADYQADRLFTDTAKFWVQLEYVW